jgi:hypothetical protein
MSSRVAGPNPSHSAPHRNYSLLDTYIRRYTRIAPWLTSNVRADHGLLRAQHFSASPRPRIAPWSTLDSPHRAWIAPCPVPCALVLVSDHSAARTLRSVLNPDCSGLFPFRFAPVTNCFVLDAWPSALRSDRSLRSASRPALSADCSAFSSWRFAPFTNYFVLDTWPSVQSPERSVLQ